ncbi:Carrier domain-containing protein OS=Streptomyces antimycoticus OX=68175 GN=SANT12839_008110 PE=4 SV=1 [Streptomyces antimycoticus]
MRPVPVGAPGELFVGGTGVARGYAGRPDLTAERFVPDPFREVGGRLYRTGDQVRWRADGRAEFLGRLDDQVKIRGYRIEPGEIQAVLSEHPVVRDAVVVARQTPAGERQLVAYYVPVRGPAEADGAELAAHCASRLPEYMLPATYLPLAEIPLNANGKTDRGRLPSPNEPQPEARAAHVAPRTSTEERVADIWAELLNVTVGVEESFFQLGGNSILAIRLYRAYRRSSASTSRCAPCSRARRWPGSPRPWKRPSVRRSTRSPPHNCRPARTWRRSSRHEQQ